MKQYKKISDLGEFGLIERIADRVAGAVGAVGVITGIGDDAAVTVPTPGMQLLTSTDMLLEDVHFRRGWHDPHRLGRKSLAVSISDIAAMGALPRWALLSLAVPAGLPLDFLDEFTRGFLAMAAEHGVALIGGDTCSSRSGLVVSVTIMGEQLPDRILRRCGAQSGHDIWVTGTLGDAAMALKMLEFDSAHSTDSALSAMRSLNGAEGNDYLTSRLLDPTPRVSVGLALAEFGLASSMIDISDGILADFGHIAEQSAVGGSIRLDDLPLSAAFRLRAEKLPEFPYQLALSGGEDYELCFTAAAENREKIVECVKKCGVKATPVGIVSRLPGVVAVGADGSPCSLPDKGFNHFT